MEGQEFFDKLDVMGNVKGKLPKAVHILYGQIDDDVEICLDDFWGFGIKEAARELGVDIVWRHLYASTWEASFLLDGVKISQVVDEREVPDAQTP